MKLTIATPRRHAHRPSFTLVEMLVVIVIIGILATLLTVAAAGAMAKAKVTRIKTELDNIAGSFKAYKTKYGSYPPNFGVDIALVQQHLRKAFPRILATELTNTNLTNLNTNTEAQTKAIYFWLSGFSADVTRPLTGPGGPFSSTPGTNEPLYDFDKSRLLPAAASLPYTAATLPTYTASGMSMPYVYFDTSRPYATAPTNDPTYNAVIRPYRRVVGAANEYMEPQGFQVLSAGIDNDWRGTTALNSQPMFPAGPFTGAHADNLGNFTQQMFSEATP